MDYRPDVTGDLLYDGVAQNAFKRDVSLGVQAEGVYRVTLTHTLRGGIIGLRRDQVLPDGSSVPNGAHVASYVTVNLTASHHYDLPLAGDVDIRFDITNIADKLYEIRDGTGVGVGAPQFGARRGFFGGVTKGF